ESYIAVDVGEENGVRAVDARVDVLDQHGARRRTVASPEFAPVNRFLSVEEERAVYVGQVERSGMGHARIDVLDEDGACRCAAASPQLSPMSRILGFEKQCAV